ncbi:hypothetical protein AB0N05_12300 [Nocardia sp. NPDC051030]|uniref:hypothetical protein n=1 Tax=Nocardia sp. NPDC051030 TaxID=3155162 RepID=UPI00341C22FA
MHDDPALAQARNFLGDLCQHAQSLSRRRDSVSMTAAAELRSLETELATVRSHIDKLQQRFPTLRTGTPTPVR